MSWVPLCKCPNFNWIPLWGRGGKRQGPGAGGRGPGARGWGSGARGWGSGAGGRGSGAGGHPFLVTAAMDAVKQGEYEPTWRHGIPARVLTTVVVNFSLGPSMRPAKEPGRKQAVVYTAQLRDQPRR